ncbi:hypothetical protein B0H66DRAFT_15054 [Apodospora peruviana]|uniref:Rhodopsin domain-containing protein n=1 Tax=Apodospora peruviana TaxID=516989 RepID=A0AAE0IQ51_9PEZI|nr:hypothetical protein B0H66DRAFT_15054 [Apodospora peruviana]
MSDGTTPPPPPMAFPPDLPHDSRVPNIIASGAVCLAISTVFVALRFYTRGFIIRVLGPTDWSILLALIFSAATTVATVEQAVRGSGHHVWDLDPTDMASGIAWARAAWYGILFYLLTLYFSKISILLLYIHLFAFKWARRAGQILLVIVTISHLFMLLTTFTACIPLQSYWDFTIPKQYCHPQSIWWSNTGLHMVTDFLIFLLPMPVVWTIMLPKRQKIMLFGVFGLGFIVCFISILRLLQLIQVENYPNPDFTWSAAELTYLTAVEVNGAIVVACVMTLKPFVVKHLPGLLTSRGTRSSSNGGSPNTMVGGPPTIGSRPSKAPLSPVDSEMMGRGRAGGVGASAWVTSGYMELDDDYGIVVETKDGSSVAMASMVPPPVRSHGSTSSGGSTDISTIKEEARDADEEREGGLQPPSRPRSEPIAATVMVTEKDGIHKMNV